MTQQEILNSNQTKTWKIQQLLSLGLTRRQVSNLLGVGYGFVQNVYARMSPERVNTRNIAIEAIEEEFRLSSFSFNHTFGVEIEAYGINKNELREELRNAGISVDVESYNHRNRPHWKIVSDRSISGNNTFEIVSPKLKGEAGLRELKTVTLILKGLETKVNKTCGLHIHLDASGFDIRLWKRLFKNYAKLELLIDSFMPVSRRLNNNYYCQSLRKENFEQIIDGISETRTLESGIKILEEKINCSSRYSKINAASYWRHRSVEFRQHSGTVQFEKISNWIIFLSRLVEYSKHAEVKTENWDAIKNFLTTEQYSYFQNRARALAS